MRYYLLIFLLNYISFLGNTQYLQRNEWQIIASAKPSHIWQKRNPFEVNQLTGIASFHRKGNIVSIVLIQQTYQQCYHIFGAANKTTIKIDFLTFEPSYFGKVYGYYKIKIKKSIDSNYKTKNAYIKYWPNRKISIRIDQYKLTVSAKQFSLSQAVIISICLSGIKILLLAVLRRRKRWTQMSETYLFIIAGWHFKYLCLLWHQYSLTEEKFQLSFFLLVILSIKSFKIVIECCRISNKTIKDMRITVSWLLCSIIIVLIVPLKFLHVVLPCIFKLQFQYYNKYSKLDTQVHYSFINLNLILSFQLIYRLYSFASESFIEILLLIYTILAFAIFFILGEYYQYSQSSNKSPLCVTNTFNNKLLCPYCGEELYYYENYIVSESESQFSFQKWRFDVLDCGHILHQKCFQKMKNLKESCPLLLQDIENIKQDKVD